MIDFYEARLAEMYERLAAMEAEEHEESVPEPEWPDDEPQEVCDGE